MFESWLHKAENDLKSAVVLSESQILDTAIYHTQQCAEKALKGFLAFCNHPLVKTHDLSVLLNHCIGYEVRFAEIQNEVEYLNGLDTEYRYPGEETSPDPEEVGNSIIHAEKILLFVKSIRQQ